MSYKNLLDIIVILFLLIVWFPWEYPLNHSYKALKFGNWIQNQVKNLSENDIMNNNINQFSNNENENNINMNNMNNI